MIIDHGDGWQVTRVELPQESSPPWCQGRGTTWRRSGLQGGNIDGKVKGSSCNRSRCCTDCQTGHRYQSSQELYSESRRRGEASETRRVEVSFTRVVFFCFLPVGVVLIHSSWDHFYHPLSYEQELRKSEGRHRSSDRHSHRREAGQSRSTDKLVLKIQQAVLSLNFVIGFL